MCYNITYKSPPMVIVTAGGLEPPRQMSANRFQSYRACQLHHAVSVENQGEGSLPDRTSPKSPINSNIPKHGHLSRGNTTIYAYNVTIGG